MGRRFLTARDQVEMLAPWHEAQQLELPDMPTPHLVGYHATTPEAAESILRNGFGPSLSGFEGMKNPVWFYRDPHDPSMKRGHDLLVGGPMAVIQATLPVDSTRVLSDGRQGDWYISEADRVGDLKRHAVHRTAAQEADFDWERDTDGDWLLITHNPDGSPVEVDTHRAPFTRTTARRDPHHGEGPWYHGTNADLVPGSVLLPGDTVGKAQGKFSDGTRVWVSNDPVRASAYGSRLYEVTPHVRPRSPYAHHDEHYTTGADVIREISPDDVRDWRNTYDPSKGWHTAAEDPYLSDDHRHTARVDAAEQVMTRSGLTGRDFHVPGAKVVDAQAQGIDTWDLQRQYSAEAEKFVNGLLRDNGFDHQNRGWVQVKPHPWAARNMPPHVQAWTDGGHIYLPNEDVNQLSLIHEAAHILHGTNEGEGHGPDFQRTLHKLYHQHLGPEAADIFAGIVFPPDQHTASADDYRGYHQGPDPEYGASLHDVEMMFPDYYTHPEYYRTYQPYDHQSESKILRFRGRPDAKVDIYRALPLSAATRGLGGRTMTFPLNRGDWVTTSYDYAKEHGESNLDQREPWTILHAKAPASQLFTEGNSIHEWAYQGDDKLGIEHPTARSQRYRRTKKNTPRTAAPRRRFTQDYQLIGGDYFPTDVISRYMVRKEEGFGDEKSLYNKQPPLSQQITGHGYEKPVELLTDGRSAHIMDGHHRVDIAKQLGHSHVPVQVYWRVPYADGSSISDNAADPWLKRWLTDMRGGRETVGHRLAANWRNSLGDGLDPNELVTLYHRTNRSNAHQIVRDQSWIPNDERGDYEAPMHDPRTDQHIYFALRPGGDKSYGPSVVSTQVPRGAIKRDETQFWTGGPNDPQWVRVHVDDLAGRPIRRERPR